MPRKKRLEKQYTVPSILARLLLVLESSGNRDENKGNEQISTGRQQAGTCVHVDVPFQLNSTPAPSTQNARRTRASVALVSAPGRKTSSCPVDTAPALSGTGRYCPRSDCRSGLLEPELMARRNVAIIVLSFGETKVLCIGGQSRTYRASPCNWLKPEPELVRHPIFVARIYVTETACYQEITANPCSYNG